MELSDAHERIRNIQNLPLLYFFREMRKLVQETTREGGGSKSDENLVYALPSVMSAVRQALPRLRSTQQLVEIKNCGPYLATIVDQVLWKEYPPAPPDDDELEAEADLAANREAGRAREKEEQRAARAAAKRAAQGGDGGGDGVEGAGSRDGPPPETAPPPKRKAAARQPKAYAPLAGTSAYAFLILMYQELKRGRGELLKDELMKLVDASGLSNKPIYGNRNSAAKPGDMHYDGWATMNKTLISKGFVSARGSPKKVKLSVEGVILAAQMYKDALLRGKIDAVPGADPDADIAQYQALLPPSPDAPPASSQLDPGSEGDDGAGSTQPPANPTARGIQSQDPGAGPSQQAQPVPPQPPKKRRKAVDTCGGTDRHHIMSFDSLPTMGVSMPVPVPAVEDLGAQAAQLTRSEHGWLDGAGEGDGQGRQPQGQGAQTMGQGSQAQGQGTQAQGRGAWTPRGVATAGGAGGSGAGQAGGGQRAGGSQWRGGRVGYSREEQVEAAALRERQLLYGGNERPRGHFDEEAEDECGLLGGGRCRQQQQKSGPTHTAGGMDDWDPLPVRRNPPTHQSQERPGQAGAPKARYEIITLDSDLEPEPEPGAPSVHPAQAGRGGASAVGQAPGRPQAGTQHPTHLEVGTGATLHPQTMDGPATSTAGGGMGGIAGPQSRSRAAPAVSVVSLAASLTESQTHSVAAAPPARSLHCTATTAQAGRRADSGPAGGGRASAGAADGGGGDGGAARACPGVGAGSRGGGGRRATGTSSGWGGRPPARLQPRPCLAEAPPGRSGLAQGCFLHGPAAAPQGAVRHAL
ncbi:MAG: hypothetical protein WDW38_011297 [Sanguina aurantia]